MLLLHFRYEGDGSVWKVSWNKSNIKVDEHVGWNEGMKNAYNTKIKPFSAWN